MNFVGVVLRRLTTQNVMYDGNGSDVCTSLNLNEKKK